MFETYGNSIIISSVNPLSTRAALLEGYKELKPWLTPSRPLFQGDTVLNVIREWDRNLCVEVHIGDDLVYRVQPGPDRHKKGTNAGNVGAIAGKILVARKFGISSMLAAFRKEDNPSMADGLDDSYKFWGGCIPILVGGSIVGFVATSGEPDKIDHEACAEGLKRFLAAVSAKL